jgi:ATP-dependent DNA helicase RecQ
MVGQADSFHISHYKLSFETDIRILVARTLITYLELDGYIKATSPRYDSYKIKPLVTSKSILNHFTGEPRQFAANLLSCLTKGRTWFTLNTVLAARQMKCERNRVIKAIEYMSEQQWLEIQVSDLVHGYRWLRRPEETKTLADDLHKRLTKREHSEVARLDGIFDLVKAQSCQAATLSQHFGESLSEPCGQCSACVGDGPYKIPDPKSRPLGSSVQRVIENLIRQYPDHFAGPRDQARFLCGLSSPAMIRAKLTRHESYGVCSGIPFPDVLAQLGGGQA